MNKNILSIVLIVLFSLIFFTAQKAACSADDTITWMDNQPYWFQLAEGNTWTWKQTTPGSDKSEIYTKKITGTVKVRGLDAVKLEVVDSEIAYGADSKGSYTAFLPDTSSNQTMVKMHIARDPIFGSYDLLFMPFIRMPRYAQQPASPPEGSRGMFPLINLATVYKGRAGILKNMPVDSCNVVVSQAFLGYEDVTVPAGTFKDCRKYEKTMAFSFAQHPQANLSLHFIEWAAKGVWVVKWEMLEIMMCVGLDMYPFNGIISGATTELVSATVNGVSYPQQ